MRTTKTMEMAEIALMSAVICIISPFTIPVPASPVPLSPATFAVYLAAVLLGAKKSVICVLIYLLLGMAGVPVFSGFSGGIGVLLGPTGGYLVGYLLCALLVGVLTGERVAGQKLCKNRVVRNVFVMVLGTLVCYLFGTVWFLVIMGGSYTLVQALLICVVPYLVFDFIKILVASVIAEPIGRVLRNCR